jgi:hypothetical protein
MSYLGRIVLTLFGSVYELTVAAIHRVEVR